MILLLLALLLCSPLQASSLLIPPQWRTFVDLDQRYNIPRRKNEILTPQKRLVTPLYHYDVPLHFFPEGLHWRESRFITADMKKFIFVTNERNEPCLRIFTRNRNNAGTLHTLGLALQSKYVAVKIQGHNSYFMLDPLNSHSKPYFIKFSPDSTSIATNDFLEASFQKTDPNLAQHLPERFFASLHTEILQDHYILRETAPAHPFYVRHIKLVPAHGFLGSPLLAQTARTYGASPQKWFLQEFIPKFAATVATLNYRYGQYPALHTQNLLFYINTSTGEIESFVFRDCTDVVLDLSVGIVRNQSLPFEIFSPTPHTPVGYPRLISRHHDTHMPGGNLAIYSLQSIWALTNTLEEGAKELAVFIEHYIKALEGLCGHKLSLSPFFRSHLKILRSGHYPQRPRLQDKINIQSQRRIIAFEMLQEIYTLTAPSWTGAFPLTAQPLSSLQRATLEDIVSHHSHLVINNHGHPPPYFVALWLTPETRPQLNFFYDGRSLFIVYKNTVTGALTIFSKEDHQKIREILTPQPLFALLVSAQHGALGCRQALAE